MKFVELLQEHGIRYWKGGEHHHVTTDFIGLDCLRCSPGSGKARLGYCLNGGFATCWTCGPVPMYEIVADITGLKGGKVVDLINNLDHARVGVVEHRGKLELPDELGELRTAHKRYLRDRGFDPHELKRLWGLKGIANAAELAWRVFIPIVSQGTTVSWTTRAIGSTVSARYVNAKPSQERRRAKDLLYGLDYVRHGVIVHEGPTDVWKTGPGAVATMGVVVTPAQSILIARHPKRVIVFDSSADAQRRAKRLCDTLSVFDGETIRVELDADDPGSASEKETKALRRMIE